VTYVPAVPLFDLPTPAEPVGWEWPHGGPYRYVLTRRWVPCGPDRPAAGGWMLFVMLNPSKATADVTDPTVTRCVGFAQREGFGALAIVNLYALRATNPAELRRHPEPVGPDNDMAVLGEATFRGDLVVVAWGAHGAHPKHRDRRDRVVRLLADVDLWCLGTTKDGEPRHPLMLRDDTPLTRWAA
jgi:hypothetical protein